MTICSSEYLASQYLEQGGVTARCIPDAYELGISPRKRLGSRRSLRCVWFGSTSPARWEEIDLLKQTVFKKLTGCTLLTVSYHPRADVRGNPQNPLNHTHEYSLHSIP